MLKFYENIKKRRIELMMFQEELGILCGYKSKSSIAKIESGLVDIPYSKVSLFATALRTSPAELLKDDWAPKIEKESGYED